MLKKIVTILNIIILGFGPAAILLLLSLQNGGFPEYPWWAVGIFLSWAFSLSLWVGLGALFKKKYPAVNQYTFFFFNVISPIGLSVWGSNELWSTLYQTSTYHFLALGIALFVTMIVAPFTNVSRTFIQSFGWMIFGGGLFLFVITLPAIWAESVFILHSSENVFGYLSRYLSLAVEAYLLFRLLKSEVVY